MWMAGSCGVPIFSSATTLNPHRWTHRWVHCSMSREFTDRITEVTKNSSNSRFHQECLEHLVSPASSVIAPPCSLGSSILVDGHFEGSLTKTQAHHGIGKESNRGLGGRCMYFYSPIPCTNCWLVRCSSINITVTFISIGQKKVCTHRDGSEYSDSDTLSTNEWCP
jgi:hypothetical protein